MKLDNS